MLHLVQPPAVAHGIALPRLSADPSEGGDALGLNAAAWRDAEPDVSWRGALGAQCAPARPTAERAQQPLPAAYYDDAAEMQGAEFPSQAHAYRSVWRWGVICGLMAGSVAMAGMLALGIWVG